MEYLCYMEIHLLYFSISDKEIISVLLTLAKRDLLCGAHLCNHFHILL